MVLEGMRMKVALWLLRVLGKRGDLVTSGERGKAEKKQSVLQRSRGNKDSAEEEEELGTDLGLGFVS